MKNDEVQPLLGYSTTLAENTVEKSLSACVDWVTVSFTSANNYTEIYEAVLGISALEKLEIIEGARYEFADYYVTYRLGKIDLMANHEKQRYLLNMSGQGCREFEMLSKYDIRTLLYMISRLLPKFTRLDIAIDDFKGIYNVSTIRKAVNKGCCVTKLKSYGDYKKGEIASPKNLTMNNFYLGNNTSRYFINVYDKRLERLNKNQPLPKYVTDTGDLKEVEIWTRTEVRFKYEYAQDFVGYIIHYEEKPIGWHIIGFLKTKLTFLSPKALLKDSNKSRLAQDIKNHARWWRAFVKDVEELPLTIVVPEHTLAKNVEWLFNQVSTSLAMLNVYDSEAYGDLLRMLTTTGDVKLQKRHLKKVADQLVLDGVSQEEAVKVFSHTSHVTADMIQAYRERQQTLIKSRTLKGVMDTYWNKLEEQLKEENKKEYTEDETELINYYQDYKEVENDLHVIRKYHDYKEKSRTVN